MEIIDARCSNPYTQPHLNDVVTYDAHRRNCFPFASICRVGNAHLLDTFSSPSWWAVPTLPLFASCDYGKLMTQSALMRIGAIFAHVLLDWLCGPTAQPLRCHGNPCAGAFFALGVSRF